MSKKKKNKEKLKRILAAICAVVVAVVFMISVIGPALAATKLEEATEKKDKAEQDMKDSEQRKKTALEEYTSIDNQISETELEITTLESQIEQTKADIVIKESELEQAEADYASYVELFKERSRVMYESSEIKYLEILFSATDFSDFLTKLDLINQIIEYDNGILVKLETAKTKIETTKKELEQTLAQQEEDAANLEEKKTLLNEILAEKEALLIEAEANIENYKAIYEAAEAAEKALIEENRKALTYESNPVTYTGGKFAWPVPGVTRITSYYGNRIHPVYKTQKFHSGIDIGAGYGLNIVASADGVVTLATTNGGYGKCIIINHGKDSNGKVLTTLYGHCSTLLVSNGDTVTKGQVIAQVGSTGVSTGPHLHFEVRENGSTVNPLTYVTA